MLYDPKWEKKNKVRPRSIQAVIAWLEKKPADEVYCYTDQGRCLAAQYNQSIGRRYKMSILGHPSTDEGFEAHLERIAIDSPYTFGAALDRARALLASQ